MSHSSRGRCALAVSATIILACSWNPAASQTRSWVGTPSNSNWHGSLNWSPIGLPLPGDSVFIGDLPGQENDSVTLNLMDAEVLNLSLLEATSLSHFQHTLTVSDTMSMSGTSEYWLAYGASPAALVAGNINLGGSSIFRMSSLSNVEVEGTLTIGSSATFYEQGGQLLLSNLANSSGAVLVNNGTISGSGTGPIDIQAAGAGKIDLDGATGSGQVDLTFSTSSVGHTMRVLSPLSDSFSGQLRIGDGSTLEVTNAWTADDLARIDLLGGRIAGGPFTSEADVFVTGPSSQASASRIATNAIINGGALDVAMDGILIFESSASFSGNADVNSNGTIRFNGSTIINGVNFSGNGTVINNTGLTIQGDVTLEATTFDWDGVVFAANSSTTISSGASLTINAINVDSAGAGDTYDGLLTMNGGTLTVNNLADEWTHAGTAVILGNNTLSGDRLVIDGDFNVTSGAQDFQAQIDFGSAADVDIFGAGTSVDTQASARFLSGTQVTVGAGSTLNLNGTVIWDGPALVDGAGTIVQNGSSVVSANTVIEVANFDWDGTGESSTTNVLESTALTINSTQIDSDNHFNGNLLIGSQSAVVVFTTPWHMDGYVRIGDNSGIGGTPVTVAGQVDVDGYGYFGSDATLVAGATVDLAPGSEFGLYSSANSIAGAEIVGPGTLTLWGATTIGAGSTVDVDSVGFINDPITMTGGQITTTNFSKDAATSFNFQGGNLTLSGGDAAFNSTFIFGGAGNPLLRIEEGADAVVTFAWRMAPGASDSATTIVTGTGGGRRSTLRGTGGGAGADLVVGLSGDGTLLVDAGGLADFRDDFIIGQNAGSAGEAVVNGVRDGFRSTVDVTGSAGNSSVQIGGGDGGGAATGILRIQNGALVETSGDVIMARYAGQDSLAFLEIGGTVGGFPAELNVADDIFVGGTSSTAGGEATIFLNDGGLLRGDEMVVWGNSTVDMNGGEMFLKTLDLTGGGEFNLLGGVLHVDSVEGQLTNVGGTISPGGSPGTTTITGDYKHEVGASLLIELAGLLPDTEYDVLFANEVLLNGGVLDVVLDGGFMPQAGDAFDILNFGRLGGTFDHVHLPALHSSLAWDASQLYTTGELSVMNASLSADFDDDGDVDGDDLDVWKKFYGQTADADANGDGRSDGRDFLAWQQQFGSSLKSTATVAAVPEPTALLLTAIGVFAMLGFRRNASSGSDSK